MVYVQLRICPRKLDGQNPLAFSDTKRSPSPGQKTRPGDSQQEKENLANNGLCHPDWPQGENKRYRKERYEPRPCLRTKKIWNMKVTVILIVRCEQSPRA